MASVTDIHGRTLLFVHLPQLSFSTDSFLKFDNDISLFQNLLLTSPRPHPLRSKCLSTLAIIRLKRHLRSHENEDLEKSISHSTEAILLPFDTPIELGSYVIENLFHLAKALLLCSQKFKQPGDLKHAIKYLRYLQDQSLETSNVTRSDVKAFLVWALAIQVDQGSVDPMRGIGEMATLCRELLTLGDSEPEPLIFALGRLTDAIYTILGPLGQPPPDGAIECLREARIRNLADVRLVLGYSLLHRFEQAHSQDDYEEAMSVADEIIADPNANVEKAMRLAGDLAQVRFFADSKPEHLAEAILRIRNHLNAQSSEDPSRAITAEVLASLERIHFEAYGVRSGRQEDIAKVVDDSHLAASPQMAQSNPFESPLPMPAKRGILPHIKALISIMDMTSNDLTDINKAIEYLRLCITFPHPHLLFTLMTLGGLLYTVFRLTGSIDYLDEAITMQRDIMKMPVPGQPNTLHRASELLINSLLSRFKLFKDRKDGNEIMRLFAVATADRNVEVRLRFKNSCLWAQVARNFRHPATPTAYETAISIMQESLSFTPTLEIQHFRLVAMRDQYEKLPLDYASYLVQIGQLKRAIETLEHGRGLLWSEMRGLRASIDQLRAANLPLAEKFAAVNRDLEALTISGSAAVWMEDGQPGGGEGMDPFGRLVMEQRKLVEERERLISQIRAQPGFDTFLIPPSFDTLRSAAAGGPVILINHSRWRSDIIILLHNSPPSLIPTSDDFYDRAKGFHEKLLGARKTGLDSGEYEDTLEEVLRHLYDLVGSPVIERLRELRIPEQSRVWWCPTSVFCSLPLHAMGPISSNGPTKLYFSDMYISSYTPTLSALIESREPSTQPWDVPSMLLVVQPDDEIPSSIEEMHIVQAVCPSVETLNGKVATPIVTLDCLRRHQFVHISCHGELETGKPFDASFELYEGAHLTLLDIVRSQLPSAEFAFLSACHTAEITEESIANEGLHLAAAVQYSGFRSVVGTMWAVVDEDGPPVAEKIYKSVFSATERWEGKPYYARTAEALRDAVRGLRKEMTLESWVNYVHYGA